MDLIIAMVPYVDVKRLTTMYPHVVQQLEVCTSRLPWLPVYLQITLIVAISL